jgi:hypothetical protein
LIRFSETFVAAFVVNMTQRSEESPDKGCDKGRIGLRNRKLHDELGAVTGFAFAPDPAVHSFDHSLDDR